MPLCQVYKGLGTEPRNVRLPSDSAEVKSPAPANSNPGNILCGKIYCNPTGEKKAQEGKGYIANSKAGIEACGSRGSPPPRTPRPFYRRTALAIGRVGQV